LISALLASSRRRRALAMIAVLSTVVAMFASEHATSKVALIAGTCAYGLVMLVPRTANRMMVAAWVSACVLVVPFAQLAYACELYKVGWAPQACSTVSSSGK
jgi:hypothetical protein